jgi:hypothetical protein
MWGDFQEVFCEKEDLKGKFAEKRFVIDWVKDGI